LETGGPFCVVVELDASDAYRRVRNVATSVETFQSMTYGWVMVDADVRGLTRQEALIVSHRRVRIAVGIVNHRKNCRQLLSDRVTYRLVAKQPARLKEFWLFPEGFDLPAADLPKVNLDHLRSDWIVVCCLGEEASSWTYPRMFFLGRFVCLRFTKRGIIGTYPDRSAYTADDSTFRKE
jgi:hypothetical protein